MTCSQVRLSISAMLDNEEPELSLDAVEAHLHGCRLCEVWREGAHAVTRRVRLGGAMPGPDLTDRILAAVAEDVAARQAVRESVGQRLLVTRLALLAIAVAELVMAVPVLLGGHDHAAPLHVAHEVGSFEVALVFGFLAAAFRPRRAAGLLPLAGGLSVLLLITAMLDLSAGRTDLADELPHALTVLGFLLLCRLAPGDADAASRPRPLVSWRALINVVRVRRPGPHVLRFAGVYATRCVRAGAAVAYAAARPVRFGAHAIAIRARGLRRAALAATVSCFALVCVAGPASAHAVLESTTPATGSVIAAAPHEVLLHFDEMVIAVPASVRVLDGSGHRVDTGSLTHPGGRGADLAIALKPGLPRGSYVVAWRVISADSHPVSGAFTFSVQATGNLATDFATHPDRLVGALLGGTRFLTFAGLALVIGGAVFMRLCWPAGRRSRRATILVWAGLATTGAATVGALGLKGPYDAALTLRHAGDISLLRNVLATPYGHALLWRLALLAPMAGWLAARRLATTRPAARLPLDIAGVLLGLALLVTVAAAGHANAARSRPLAMAVDAVHVGAMCCWIGGLIVLVAVVLPRRDPETTATALPAFSKLAFACVALLIATGSYQALTQIDSLAEVGATTYGRLLVTKVSVFAALIGVAAISRAWVRRRYHSKLSADVAHSGERPPGDVRRLRRSVGVEAGLATAVLAVTAILVVTQPARTAYHPTTSATLTAGPATVQISAVPTGNRTIQLHAYTYDRGGSPLAVPEMTAALFLPTRGIGPLDLHLRAAGPGHFVTNDVSVPIAGAWQLQLQVRTSDIDSYPAATSVTIR